LKPNATWQLYRFDQIARNINERVLPADAEGLPYVGLEHLDSESLKIRRWGTPDEVEAQKLRFYPGDIIFGKRRFYQRKLAVAEVEGICSAHAMVLRAKEDVVDPSFLPFFMQGETFFERAMAISVGSLSPTINWTALARQEFPLPPLDEQRRIAEILWAVEEAIEEYFLVESAVRVAKHVYATEQFRSLPPRVDFTFRQVGDWLSGGTPSRNNPSFWAGNVPWASPKDMKVDVLHDTEEHVSLEGVQVGSRLLPPNSILFVTRGMILAHTFPVALTGTHMAFNQDLRAIVPNEKFDATFIFYWLQYNAAKLLTFVTESSHGTKRLPSSILESMLFPSIVISEQKRISKQLHSFDQQARDVARQFQALRELKKKLIDELLDGASLNVQ
jgi:type I restriction enzyme S subunit